MEDHENKFREISQHLVQQYPDVTLGKMMSSPGIIYKNKVFAFYFQNQMTFKLGKSFVPEDHGIVDYSLLSPFKNKPLAGWFIIPQIELWNDLTDMALERIMIELGN